MNLEPKEAAALLRDRLAPVIAGLNVLNEENPYGIFNRHDKVHIEAVHQMAHLLLDDYEYQTGDTLSPQDRIIASAIAYIHDIGNNISRRQHSEFSALMFTGLFENYKPTDPRVQSIIRGIVTHDEPVGERFKSMLDIRDNNSNLAWQAILAVIAADKLDISRHRLSTALAEELAATSQEIIEKVPHTLTVLYAANDVLNFFLGDGGFCADWHIDFSTDASLEPNPELREILEKFIRKFEDISVPATWHDSYKNPAELTSHPYVSSYLTTMMRLYCVRTAMLLSSLYTLLPDLKSFTITVEDRRDFTPYELSVRLDRETWPLALFVYWKNANQQAYKQGRIEVPPILQAGEEMYQQGKQRKLKQSP